MLIGDKSTITFFFLIWPSFMGPVDGGLAPIIPGLIWLLRVKWVYMSEINSYCSRSNYRLCPVKLVPWFAAPFLMMKFCRARDEAGRATAFVCAHYGHTLSNGFFSWVLGSGTCGLTPAMISYNCKSFVRSYIFIEISF